MKADSKSAQIVRDILSGNPFTYAELIERHKVSNGLPALLTMTLKGQGAEFEEQRPNGTGPKVVRLTKPPTHPERPSAEALRIARAEKNGGSPVSDKRGWLADQIRTRLIDGEQHSVQTLMAFYPAYSKNRVTSTFNTVRESLRRKGHRLSQARGMGKSEIVWFVDGVPMAPRSAAVEVVADEQPAPPRKRLKLPDPPPFGQLLEITAMAKVDGELHIVISENGNAWSCIVMGHTATQH